MPWAHGEINIEGGCIGRYKVYSSRHRLQPDTGHIWRSSPDRSWIRRMYSMRLLRRLRGLLSANQYRRSSDGASTMCQTRNENVHNNCRFIRNGTLSDSCQYHKTN
jgi:hypothetical protein